MFVYDDVNDTACNGEDDTEDEYDDERYSLIIFSACTHCVGENGLNGYSWGIKRESCTENFDSKCCNCKE